MEFGYPFIYNILCRYHICNGNIDMPLSQSEETPTAHLKPNTIKEKWYSLYINMGSLNKLDWKSFVGSPFEFRAHKVLQYCTHALASNTFKRADYRELCELIIVYLSGNVQNFIF